MSANHCRQRAVVACATLLGSIIVLGGSGCAADRKDAEGGLTSGRPDGTDVTLRSDSGAALDSALAASDGATLEVLGMSCPKCVSNVDIQLRHLPSVADARINMGAGTVAVDFAANEHPTASELARAVDDAGLTLVRIHPRSGTANAAVGALTTSR